MKKNLKRYKKISFAFKINKKKILFGLLIMVLALLPASYFYYRFQKSENLLKTTEQKNQLKDTLDKVGLLVELPKNEIPTIASVTDKNKLSNQIFFTYSENGDQVLIYTKAKRAILYRPSINKIIDITSINLTVPTEETTPEPLEITPTESL